ncbi:hypothetical protein CTheo_1015 [Ceratobasidium theobromae]|uniref:Uncharacterized protein n=1 Tax=Ceratobasidium theobromae TaxID=1582974 RepID=A0A5N5QV53_9AGAM|nr:hypothetical protein CTheo_1015 [Ceratobasidium theobromae]
MPATRGAAIRRTPYQTRERTKSTRPSSLSTSDGPGPQSPASPLPPPKPKTRKQKSAAPPPPPPVLRSPLFNGVNPAYLVRAMRAIARGNYPNAHGYLHLCIVQARNVAAARGGVSSLVVCLLMLYSDNWLRLGIPSRAIASMEDALTAQEKLGEETDEDRQHATLAGLELRQYMQSAKPAEPTTN